MWIFNLWGTIDFLYAYYNGIVLEIEPGLPGASYRLPSVDRRPDMLNSGTHLPNRHSGRGKMDEAELLKQTPLFRNLGADDIERMAQSTRIQNYKAGQTIVIEGRVGAAFFIVVSGSVEVFKRRKDSDEVVLATLGAGEFFGELATMKHVPRSANVRALQDTTCLVIRRADFESYIRQFPDVAEVVESTLIARFGESRMKSEGEEGV